MTVIEVVGLSQLLIFLFFQIALISLIDFSLLLLQLLIGHRLSPFMKLIEGLQGLVGLVFGDTDLRQVLQQTLLELDTDGLKTSAFTSSSFLGSSFSSSIFF